MNWYKKYTIFGKEIGVKWDIVLIMVVVWALMFIVLG